MNHLTLRRLSGAAAIAAGPLCVLGGVLHPVEDGQAHNVEALLTPHDFGSFALLLGTVLLLLGLPGVYGWLLATLLFALLHSGPGPAFRLWTLFAAVAGALFGAIMLWRGNLLGPVVAHFVVNAVNLKRVSDAAVRNGDTTARVESDR